MCCQSGITEHTQADEHHQCRLVPVITLPNVMQHVLVIATIGLSLAIISAATLSLAENKTV